MRELPAFQLTEIERACGVTLEDVARELPRVLLRGDRVLIDGNVGPALASAVARAALDWRDEGVQITYVGMTSLKLHVYALV